MHAPLHSGCSTLQFLCHCFVLFRWLVGYKVAGQSWLKVIIIMLLYAFTCDLDTG